LTTINYLCDAVFHERENISGGHVPGHGYRAAIRAASHVIIVRAMAAFKLEDCPRCYLSST